MNEEVDATDEFGPVGPTLLTNLGGGALMLAALMTLLAGGMIWKTGYYTPVTTPAGASMSFLGLFGLMCGGGMIKARDWAAIVGAGLTGLMLLVNLGFNIWAGLNGGLYSWSAFAMVFTMIAAMLVPFAIKDCLVASRNRRKLLEGI